MRKRIWSALLILCMMVTLLPTAALAADTVGKVMLTVDAPKVGGTPAATASVPETASTYVKAIRWLDAATEKDMAAGDTFQAGKSYTLYAQVCIKDGQDKTFKINYASNITVNGKEAKFQVQNSKEIIIWYTFKLASNEVKTELTTVAATVTDPVAGASPVNSATATANGSASTVKVEKVQWGGQWDVSSGRGVYKDGGEYVVNISLTPASGYAFGKDLTATVNGKAAEVFYNTAGKLMIKYSYKPTAEEKAEAAEAERFSMKTWITMAEAEPQRTSDRDTVFVGSSAEPFNAMSEVEQKRVRKIILTGHDVAGAKALLSAAMGVSYRVEEFWFGPEYTAAEANDILKHLRGIIDFRYYDVYLDGSALSAQPHFFLPDKLLGSFDTETALNAKDVRFYSGTDPEAAAKLGASAAKNWCTSHQYVKQLVMRAGTVHTYPDCTHGARFYYVCFHCGQVEKNPAHLSDWTNTDATGRPVSGGSSLPRHDFVEQVRDDAYIGTDVNGNKVYWMSCSRCGYTKKQEMLDNIPRRYADSDKSATYAEYEKIWLGVIAKREQEALSGKNNVAMFRIANTVSAKTSGWAQAGVNDAFQEGLLDAALLGGDYTKACTRLQFCSVAVKLAEKMTGKAITPAPADTFTDTQNEYVLKAYAAGITSGTSATTFSPDATLNRQQMATFIYRALQYVKANSTLRYTPYTSKLASYTDRGQLQSWAEEPMAFMNALGLIAGTSNTMLSPLNNCTIEQALIVAKRSLNAHKIGYYIVRSDKELRGNWFGYRGRDTVAFPINVEMQFQFGISPREGAALKNMLNSIIANMDRNEVNQILTKQVDDIGSGLNDFVYHYPFEIICFILIFSFSVAMIVIVYTRIQGKQKISMYGYDESYRMLADAAGEAGFKYDYLSDTMSVFGTYAYKIALPAEIRGFRSYLLREDRLLSLTKEQFDQMLMDGLTKKAHDIQLKYQMVDGTWRNFKVTFSVIATEAAYRRPIYMVGYLTDIEEEYREKETLVQLGLYDSISGLYNRYGAECAIEKRRETRRSVKDDVLLMMDVDNFKDFNDIYGHKCGDDVLKFIGQHLADIFRAGDIICRWGGDEFMIYAANAAEHLGTITQRCESLREILMEYRYQDQHIPVTVSIGGAVLSNHAAEEAFLIADKALYKVKQNGKSSIHIEKD